MKNQDLRDVYVSQCSCDMHDGVFWSHMVRLPTPDGYFTHPEISRCGRKVAFWGICDGLWDVWYCTLTSLKLYNITKGKGTSCHPTWSPDGQCIAYSRSVVKADSFNAYGNPWCKGSHTIYRDIWVYYLKSGENRQLTHLGADTERPAWSPDGKSIAYVVSNADVKGIGIHTIQSNKEYMVITNEASSYYRPAWDPYGKRLACNNKGPGDHVLWLCNVDGSGLCQLTKRPVGEPEVHDHGCWWSSDGNTILFHSDRGGAWGLWTVDVHSGSLQRITLPNFPSISHGTWDTAEKTLCFDAPRFQNPVTENTQK
jgi:Tol biopolymer transport system component